MRCPECDSKRLKRILYGAPFPTSAFLCPRCNKLFRIKVEEIEFLVCSRCKQAITTDASKYAVMANGTVHHRRCPKRK
jgi:ribosomal protein L37AE/L43A